MKLVYGWLGCCCDLVVGCLCWVVVLACAFWLTLLVSGLDVWWFVTARGSSWCCFCLCIVSVACVAGYVY